MLSILVHAAIIYFAYKLGQWSIVVKIAKELKEKLDIGLLTEEQINDAIGVEKNQRKSKSEILLEIERVDSVYYAYNKEGYFLAQGSDFRSLLENIRIQHPGQDFKIEKYQPSLTEEETGRLIKSIFEVYGDKNEKT